MGKSRCPTKGWNREGVSLQAQKFELFPSVGYHPYQKIKSPCPFPDHRPNIKKKCISNSFQILPKILPVACIFSYTNVTFEKARWN